MAARVRQIEAKLAESKMMKLEAAASSQRTMPQSAMRTPAEPKEAVVAQAEATEKPTRRPTGIEALQTEPSGSFEHFTPGAWKPAPGKRIRS
jgi:hypothetical protein